MALGVSRRAAAFGLPSVLPKTYAEMILATPGIYSYWPGNYGPTYGGGTLPSVFTLECWTYITSVQNNHAVWSNWNGTGCMIWVDFSNTRFMFHVNSSDLDSGVGPSANTWYYLVASYDGSDRRIYVNGTLRNGPSGGVTPGAGYSLIQTHNYPGDGGALSGYVADPAIYSRALTDREVLNHYNYGRR